MSNEEVYIRHCMLYEYNLGRKATEATKNICYVYGEDALDVRKCQRWFAKFRSGDTSLEESRGGKRTREFDQDALRTLVEENPYLTQQELAKQLNASQATVSRQLQEIGKVQKLGKWVPHELTENNKIQRFQFCTFLSSRQNCDPFLNRLVTGDEKWILYSNVKRRKHGWTRIRCQNRLLKLVCTQRKSCYVFGGISEGSSTLSYFKRTKL